MLSLQEEGKDKGKERGQRDNAGDRERGRDSRAQGE